MVVRVGVRVVARDAVERLRIGPGIQLVAVEVVERRPVDLVRAALGRDDDTGEAAELRAVRVGEHLHFGDGIQARCGVGQLTEDPGRGRLPVLDVRGAVGASAQELNRVEAADDVRVEGQEVLDVAAVAGQVAQLLCVQAACDRRALHGDVLALGDHGDDVLERAHFELDIGAGHRRGPQEDARPSRGLEAGEADVDRVAARAQVGHLEEAFAGAHDLSRDAGVLVGHDDRRAGDDRALRVAHRASDRAERRLRGARRGRQHRDRDESGHAEQEARPPNPGLDEVDACSRDISGLLVEEPWTRKRRLSYCDERWTPNAERRNQRRSQVRVCGC